MRSACASSASSASGVKVHAEQARGLDEAGLAGLRREREHPPLALGRAGFRERAARERRDRLARNAAAAADPDGDEPHHGLTNRHCTTGIAARQPEKRPTGSAWATAICVSSPP